jgi:restriction system protein
VSSVTVEIRCDREKNQGYEAAPMFEPPPPFEHFVGRSGQLVWMERLVLSHEHWFQPHFVVGPAGVGKTALVSHFLATLGPRFDFIWIRAAIGSNPDALRSEFDKRIRQRESRRFDGDTIVVVDQADVYPKNALDGVIGMVLNYKRVRALIITTRKKPSFERAPVLTLAGLTIEESGDLFKLIVKANVSEEILQQVLARVNGNPLLLTLVAGVLNAGGAGSLTSVLNVPIYDINEAGDGKIITVAKPRLILVKNEIVVALKKEPESIFTLPPRKFEELLAELLESQGMTVELTPRSKDGGRDILAYSESALGKFLCLVEAKRYAETHKVGVELVRQLYGVLCDHLATSAMLVTTSSFTKGAKEFQQRHQYEMSLRDCSDVLKWIDGYKNPVGKLILPT